jgi:6-phosphogluconolactonase
MAEPDIHVAPVDALAAVFVQRVALEANRAIAERGRFSIVVPGGSVADRFLPVLLAQPLAWEKCDVFWGDERAVPFEAADSNAGTQRTLWEAKAPAASLFPMNGGAENLAAAAAEYEATLRARLGPSPQFDIVVLGAGPDGHVASLFPTHLVADETPRLVEVVENSPKPPPLRLTMTLPLLANARWLCVAVFGASKSGVVNEALNDGASSLPLARVLRRARRATVLLDDDAARHLRSRGGDQSAAETSTRLS